MIFEEPGAPQLELHALPSCSHAKPEGPDNDQDMHSFSALGSIEGDNQEAFGIRDSATKLPLINPEKSRCCTSGTESCDESCIEVAAAFECHAICQMDSDQKNKEKKTLPTLPNFPLFQGINATASPAHIHPHDESGLHPTEACQFHRLESFERFASWLDTARCICRSMYNRAQTSKCCLKRTGAFDASLMVQPSSATPELHRSKATVGNKSLGYGQGSGGKEGLRHQVDLVSADEDISDRDPRTSHAHKGACHANEHEYRSENSCDIGSDSPSSNSPQADRNVATSQEMESAKFFQHISLVVSGMTCSGCGNKMEKALKGLPGVSRVRINFVVGSAEFLLDSSKQTPEQIISDAERISGFGCTRRVTHEQYIDVLVSRTNARTLTARTMIGLTSADLLDSKTVRLAYNPEVVGARTLFEQLHDLHDGLAPPRNDPLLASGRKKFRDQLWKTVVAGAFTLPVAVMAWADDLVNEATRGYVSVVLATIVQLIAIPDFYRPAISNLLYSRIVEMDMLVVISITAAYVYSLTAFSFRLAGHPLEEKEFFETSSLLVTLVLLGRLVAAFARIKAVAAVSIRSLQASMVVVVVGGRSIEMDVRLLQIGDVFKVAPHSIVPTDGSIIDGVSEIDESMLTGEGVPVAKGPGDVVMAGTFNGRGNLIVRLTRLPGKNTVTDIAEMVERASATKPKLQDLADRIAGWFVPVVSFVAIVVVAVWLAVGIRVRNYSTGKAISNAITFAVATLAISCPCALGLAVPMVLVIAGGVAARQGVIIKSSQSTECARKMSDVVFDKTGTMTENTLEVVEEMYLSDHSLSVSITKALVAGNTHPVSSAIDLHLTSQSACVAVVAQVHSIPGAGIEARVEDQIARAGNSVWTSTENVSEVIWLQRQGYTILVVTLDSRPIAIFGLRSRLRPESQAIVTELLRRGISVHLVSGDQKQAVETTASQLGITECASQCSPGQKGDYVSTLIASGKNVMFVGDGTNDAVAVAQATIGVQLSHASATSEMTRGAADVILLAGLQGILHLIDISNASFNRMFFNFCWSAVYNVLAILLASGALVRIRVPPAYVGLGEIVSVLPVILAAATMLLKKSFKSLPNLAADEYKKHR